MRSEKNNLNAYGLNDMLGMSMYGAGICSHLNRWSQLWNIKQEPIPSFQLVGLTVGYAHATILPARPDAPVVPGRDSHKCIRPVECFLAVSGKAWSIVSCAKSFHAKNMIALIRLIRSSRTKTNLLI